MSAATDTKNDTANRNDQLEAYASTIRAENGKIRTSIETIGRTLRDASGLFTAAQQDKWSKWSTLVTGWSFGRVKNVMRAVEILDELDEDTTAAVESWTLDAVHQLSSAVVKDDDGEQDDEKTAELRGKIVGQVKAAKGSASPTPEQVRDTRDKVTGNTRRQVSEDERAGKLADKIADEVTAFTSTKTTVLAAMMKGASLQKDHGGDVAMALAILAKRHEDAVAAAAAAAAEVADGEPVPAS